MSYTAAQIAEAISVSERAIQKRSKKEAWPSLKRSGKGGGKLFSLSSLPQEVRTAIGAWEAGKAGNMEIQSQTTKSKKSNASAPVAYSTPLPAALDDKRRYGALAKADLVRLYLNWLRVHGRAEYQKNAFIAAYLGGAYPELLKEFGRKISWKSIERWKLEQARHKTALALADKRGLAHRGRTILTDQHRGIILGQILNPNAPKVSQCARQIQKRCLAEGIFEPSEATIRRFVERYVSECFDEWTLFREGQKAWNDKCAISILRDWGLVEVGDIVIADGHILNFETLNPETGKPSRMMLVLFYDGASSHPLGWEIMPTENTACISSAFRRTCILLGLFPKVVYLDNGRAFRAKFFKGCEDFSQAGICGLYESLGCNVIHAWPYHGQSKPIERFFGSFNDMEVFVPSYVGTSIENKPARMNRGEDRHRALYAKMGGRPLTLEETHLAVASWFGEYVQRPNRAAHLGGRTPQEVFQAGRGQGLTDEQIRRMDLMMLSREIRTISKDGIKLNGRLYWHEALASRRHPVVVRYDDQLSPYTALVYDQDGNLLCEARDREHYKIACGVHPAADALGTTEQQEDLREALALKKRQERGAAGNMTLLLNATVMPEVQARQAALDADQGRVLEQGKVTKLQPSPKSRPIAPLSTEEVAVIEAAKAKARAAMNAAPSYVPASDRHFRDDLDRYTYLFTILHEEKLPLALPDAHWMETYEQTPEFQRGFKKRFDDLLALYAFRAQRAQVK